MIIGIVGKARSGKDTAASYIAEKLGGFSTIAYADALKEELSTKFNLTEEQLYGSEKDLINPNYIKSIQDGVVTYWTNREIMQAYGQFMRSIDHDYWVKRAFEYISSNNLTNIIITDVRQFNEALAIKNRGGILIKINRLSNSKLSESSKLHNTETQLDAFGDLVDITVDNIYNKLDSFYPVLDLTINTIKKEYKDAK